MIKKSSKAKAPIKKVKVTVKKAPHTKKEIKKKNLDTSSTLIAAIVKGIEEKKGLNIVTLNLKNTGNTMADYFVICHATNKIQVNAIVGSIEEEVFKITNEVPKHIEGRQNAEWILMDYFNVVAHIFVSEKRDFFNLENLWADAFNEKIVAHK